MAVADEQKAFDYYSHAVMTAAERAGPAVVKVEIGHGGALGGFDLGLGRSDDAGLLFLGRLLQLAAEFVGGLAGGLQKGIGLAAGGGGAPCAPVGAATACCLAQRRG